MRCQKGKSEDKPKKGRYRCDKCGAVSKDKKHLCKADLIEVKVKKDKSKSKGKKNKKGC